MIVSTLRRAVPLLAIFIISFPLHAQQRTANCINPTATANLDINGVRALITNGGDLWFDGQDGRYEVTGADDSPEVNPVSAIFAGGLWLGAKDPGGGLKIAAQQYGRGLDRFDYFPGPLTSEGIPAEGDCSDWDRLFKVNRTTTDLFQTLYEEALTEGTLPLPIDRIPLEVLGWPGSGNPNFEGVYGFELPASQHGLAPYFDVDLDGIYNPRMGDYPLFCGDQAVWGVFNDAGNVHAESGTSNSLQAEIHLLAYAFASEDSVLHRTTFYEYTIINKGTEDALDLYAGHWIDSDLGCFTNDLIGSSPENNLFYVYNENGTDPETCSGGIAGYGATSPVNIFQVVSSFTGGDPSTEDPLMVSMTNVYNAALGSPPPGIVDPSTPVGYYNLLTGRWPDGTPITRGGYGYETGGDTTLFAYDGGEVNGAPWTACAGPTPFVGDLRQVYATGPYDLQPGASTNFTLAVTTVFEVDYPDGSCPDTSAVFSAAEQIKDFYDEMCTYSALVSTQTPAAPTTIGLEVFPNPAAGQMTFRLPTRGRIDRVEIFDLTGRQLTTKKGTGSTLDLDPRSAGLVPGVYVYRLRTVEGAIVAGRVVVL